MIQRQLFPDEYDNVDEAVLNAAATYGTNVHASIEDFDKNWNNDGTVEVADYIEICKEHGLVHEASEYIVSDNKNWASMIDKVYRVSDDTFSIGDIKTYGVMTQRNSKKQDGNSVFMLTSLNYRTRRLRLTSFSSSIFVTRLRRMELLTISMKLSS